MNFRFKKCKTVVSILAGAATYLFSMARQTTCLERFIPICSYPKELTFQLSIIVLIAVYYIWSLFEED